MARNLTENAAVFDALRDIVGNAKADQVFGPPISHDGMIVLPAAEVRGGGGGGGGGGGPAEEATGAAPSGAGGGFGLSARPLGVYVIREGGVSWHPALDVNKIILGGQLVVVAALLLARSWLKTRRKG
jgi:uncharacterized spore protein YtfJ